MDVYEVHGFAILFSFFDLNHPSKRFGVTRKGSPRFVPISPFSSDLLRFAFLVFWNTIVHAMYTYYIFLGIGSASFESPKNFSRHAPVTKKTYTLIRHVCTALWQIRPVKVHRRTPSPIPAR